MSDPSRIRTVSAFLRNPEGMVIAQLRDDKPGLLFPGRWSTLGGRIEAGETPDEAAQRELMEEIEYAQPLTFWRMFPHRFTSGGRDYDVDIYAYVGKINQEVADIHLHEGQQVAYLSADDVDRLQFAFGLDDLFREYFKTHDHRTGSNL
jgi:8-oxo-dGTP diphosphatase